MATSPAEAQQLRGTLAVASEDPIPSVATYNLEPGSQLPRYCNNDYEEEAHLRLHHGP
jgi:hypothetical protein